MNYRKLTLAMLMSCLILLAISVAAENSTGSDWPVLPTISPAPEPPDPRPAELHQQLGEAKAAQYVDKLLTAKLAAAAGEANIQEDFEVEFYDLFIRVDDTAQYIYGSVRMLAVATQDNVTQVQLDFDNTMIVDSVTYAGGTLAFTHPDDYMYVTLNSPVNTDGLIDFTVHYQGYPTGGGFGTFTFTSRSGNPLIWSLSEPYGARCWWPCKDRMDDKPDSVYLSFEIDTSLFVGSNGTLDSTVHQGDNTHISYYSCRYPIATYLVSLSIHPYTVWSQYYYYNGGVDSMIVLHASYPEYYSESLPGWGITPGAIGIFADKFGEYPFVQEKYGHSACGFSGGMEHQTMTSIAGYGWGFSADLIVHELSHQWWGDMITCKSWEDIWLNEGWASYSEAVYFLELYGWDYYRSYMNTMKYTGGGTIWCDDTTSVGRIFDHGLSYNKGAWVVHMLRGVLGEEKFFDGVDAYYNSEYQYGAATTAEFEQVWEDATGVELSWFFEDWIYGTYLPNYKYYWTTEPADGGGYDLYMVVKQIQSTQPQVFRMPVDVLIQFASDPADTVVFTFDEKRKSINLHFDDDVTGITLDPAQWVLCNKSSASWTMLITTPSDSLAEGEMGVMYKDSVEVLGGSGDYTFTLTMGTWPDGITIDAQGVISGIPADTGTYTFDVHVWDNVQFNSDQATFNMHVGPNNGCCGNFTGGYTGNANCDTEGKRNLADISKLIDRVYLSKEVLCCEENGNANGDIENKINLADISRLIDHVYLSKSETAVCP